jgi:hypothetical protein
VVLVVLVVPVLVVLVVPVSVQQLLLVPVLVVLVVPVLVLVLVEWELPGQKLRVRQRLLAAPVVVLARVLAVLVELLPLLVVSWK